MTFLPAWVCMSIRRLEYQMSLYLDNYYTKITKQFVATTTETTSVLEMYSIIFTLVRQYLTRIANLSILIPANCAVYYRNIVSTERGKLRLKGKREGNS